MPLYENDEWICEFCGEHFDDQGQADDHEAEHDDA